MKKTTFLFITMLLCVLMIAGCSDSDQKTNGEPVQTFALPSGEAVTASFTDTRVAGMKGIAENEQLRLFLDDQTGAVAVLHKKSGEIWHSNPVDRDSDPLAAGINKDLLSSQLKIDFYNMLGQTSSVNSYSDSVVHNQLAFERIPSGIRVTYQFGTDEKTADDMPMMISKERLERFMSGLDKTGQRALIIAYTEDKEKSVYVRNDQALQGLQLERALKALEDAGYTEEDLLRDIEENSLDQTKPEPRIFLAAVEYTLDGEHLVVNVPISRIQYPEEYPVNSISVLGFFGAAGTDVSGSILVPDGSGALIHFNNGKTKYPAYQQQVYGSDLAMESTDYDARNEEVRLPVFGMIRENTAFLGIIEEGASAATIHADISGRLNSYNYVYPSFYVLNKGEVTLDASDQKRSLPKFQEQPMKSDFTVRYAFLSGEDASYQGMARYYQQYLLNTGGLPQPQEQTASDSPFYVELIGAITKQKHMAGIPYQSLEELTTLEEAKSIVLQMKERGIHHIKLKYAGWFNGGLDHKVPERVSVDGAIGGSKGLEKFVSFAEAEGISFYPDTAIVIAHHSEGFSETKDASRTLSGVPAKLYPLDLALNRRDRDRSPSYIVSPRLVNTYASTVTKKLEEYETGGISLRDLADQLNSDFRENRQIDRTESEDISVQALEHIRGKLEVMASGGNAYALPYLTDITNAPMKSSKFKIEDEEIPFYSMVVRGFIDYTGAPFNLSTYTGSKPYVLKCLEYGAGVYFEWIYKPNYEVKDTEYDDLYAVNYEQWIDQAAEMYEEVNAFLKQVQGERIISHEKLDEGVMKTVYENGVYVIVNYNDREVMADGRWIEAESYLTGGGNL
ncbi:DUF5696 domain-containing protein [Marinicrinis lubricantis]|uniref:DUF5696 domain-containing protein n=1 Tax=Marinicrinis lubricantis TaxID=2086470 RepID=A0ABW1IW07_9BACL